MGGGGEGEGMETEVRLSTGAFEAMWRDHVLRPVVLQLADEPRRMEGGPAADPGPYRVALSDGGERLLPGILAESLDHLVVRGALRRGTVVRVLEYFAGFFHNERIIVVIQLEILQAECTLIRSPTIFEANATQRIGISCSGGLAIHEPCFMPATQQVISNSSCYRQALLHSPVTARAEPTVNNLPFSKCFCSMLAQRIVDAKMQQLSLNDHQNQRFPVTATGDAFGPLRNSYASPMLASYLQDSPGLSGAIAAQLTPGAVVALSEHVDGNGTLQPVLQVVDVRMFNNVKNPSAERFRIVLSDGVYTMPSLLAATENTRVRDGSIQKGSIIHLQEFTCCTIQNRRIIIVTKLYVLQSECNIMGNPMRIQPNEQGTILLANAAQANTRTYPSGPGMLGSSVAPMPAQVANNVPYGGSYGGYQGTVGPPTGHAVESVPDVASDVSYGITSAHTTMNVGMVQSNLQQPSLNSHQNQRFAVPSMAGGSGAPGNSYGQPAQSFYQQPPPGHMNRTLVSKNDASRLVPVAQLNPYRKRWTIKARVTSKTDLRHYNNAKGAGKFFSFDLLDGQGGEIRATCFNAQADQFFDLIEVNNAYLISKGSLKPALKKLNSLNHKYEILVDHTTSIKVCVDDDSNIPRQQYNFRQIREIENVEVGAIVDLVGIVTSVGPSAIMMRKDGTQAQKRTLQLKDMSVRSVEIILWGKFCDAEGHQLQMLCDSGSNPILFLKGGRVSDFSCRSVVSISSTQLKVNPDLQVAESLKQWYVTEGKNASFISLSQEISNMSRNHVLKTIAQIKDEKLGQSGKPDLVTVRAVLSHVGADESCYQAWTSELNGKRCYKKVTENGDGTWRCDRCNQSSENCEYTYLLLCQIKDHTGTIYATAFQEAAEAIFGHTAQELFMIRNVEQDDVRFTEIMQAVLWREYLFKLKIKEQSYNGEQHVSCTIIGVEKLEETDNLLKDVSRPILKDDLSYMPNVGSANLEARQSRLTSSNANFQLGRASYSSSMLTSSNVDATGFAQSNWMPPTPQSASFGCCDFNGGFGFLGRSAVRGAPLCFKCNQLGHLSKDCLV